MKARLIAHKSTNWVGITPSGDTYPVPSSVFPWPLDTPIPEGYEEVEIVTGRPDLCNCGHKRSEHASYHRDCVVTECNCPRFEETG